MESLLSLNVQVVNPPPDAIQHFAVTILDHRLEFEWHPVTKRVYLIHFDGVTRMGEPIAFEIENHGAAWNAVLVFNRGYKAALQGVQSVSRSLQPRGDAKRTE